MATSLGNPLQAPKASKVAILVRYLDTKFKGFNFLLLDNFRVCGRDYGFFHWCTPARIPRWLSTVVSNLIYVHNLIIFGIFLGFIFSQG